ncbi:MAG: hypothetical protein Q8P57_02705 [Candidatus Pacearchaeota archaeon]|nr:hypothetical protein [Candidatus Pacearchaeota archaeon]
MKRIELERAIQEQSDRIAKSQIIPKCRDIAQQLGEGRRTSQEWATANYKFSGDLISIDYQIYAMGDQQLIVASRDERVFEAVERGSTPPEYPNPVIDVDGRRFEILSYKPGRWEQGVETLYHKMTTDVPEEELRDAQQRLGIALS